MTESITRLDRIFERMRRLEQRRGLRQLVICCRTQPARQAAWSALSDPLSARFRGRAPISAHERVADCLHNVDFRVIDEEK